MTSSVEQRQLLEQVQQADFVVTELTLYLNTHPTDHEALEQWRKAIRAAAKVRKEYEKRYGPLTLYATPSEEAIEMGWRWSNPPWPWQL